ncbi:AsnC family transcriptional regulator [Rhodococcus sp. Leaf7]|jgi:DNA-binding Lrp family transcriptional regulator|uniref:Lrp/AsnC family transcriptional regulator n=1 Tax=unclassified Rhodococcus (in: high G+C Gram-positive bacteria) TaxID=192944 RepID=UPI0005ACB726|nr:MULTISPECIES: Lrp/AsnC ligand binding domain-containing protein [unclassified Rhodococcus (in: high G+C Gram-positive bacteria)]KIQ16201.1 AsnC family transcriptional regulator [Rhodococcus sp. MEB064]KQU02621.1 AsnC family transcriptional regulator [Rhodococcus sp. Leaf7]KQU38093.1 AsnC family transcriptional regulator [Rhodococcus sp. Leaf247]
MITAIVMIHAEVHTIPETARAVADVPGVSEVFSCAGDVDLIAVVKVRSHEEIAEVITERVNRIDGVVRTDTHIAFKSYSSADIDAGFSIGE